MNVLTGLLSAVSPQNDGSVTDKLNYCFTTVGLVVASAFVSGWSFVGSPIQCWFPAYYKGWWMEYALDYCYVQNTYFVPMVNQSVHSAFDFGKHMVQIPTDFETRKEQQIGYYQWVPFVLAFQALFFYLPIVIWRNLYDGAGFRVGTICDSCASSANMDEDTRQKNMSTIAGFLTVTIGDRGEAGSRLRTGRYVFSCYMLVKVLFVINAALQFCLLRHFLGVDSYMWGLDVTGDLLAGREWAETGNFPRITMCDYDVRVLGSLHRHTVQCVLMINMFNEKVFVIIWYWFALIFIASLTDFVNWLVNYLQKDSGADLINQYILKYRSVQIDPTVARSMQKKSLIKAFIHNKLRPDGVFVLRLVAANSGEMVTCALLKTLWEEFISEKDRRPPPYNSAEPLLMKASKIDEAEL